MLSIQHQEIMLLDDWQNIEHGGMFVYLGVRIALLGRHPWYHSSQVSVFPGTTKVKHFTLDTALHLLARPVQL